MGLSYTSTLYNACALIFERILHTLQYILSFFIRVSKFANNVDIFQLIFVGFETNNSILLKLEKSEYLRTFRSLFFIYNISDYFIFLKKIN